MWKKKYNCHSFESYLQNIILFYLNVPRKKVPIKWEQQKKNAYPCQKRKGYLFNKMAPQLKMGPQLLTIYIKKQEIFITMNIGGSEGNNKTSKILANKISDKWDLKWNSQKTVDSPYTVSLLAIIFKWC